MSSYDSLEDSFEDRLDRLHEQITLLGNQLEMAGTILDLMDDNDDEFEREYITDDEEDTVVYHTDRDGYVDDSDEEFGEEETVVLPWTDPYCTPTRYNDWMFDDDDDDDSMQLL